jgi:hypothetical protein
VLDSPIINSDYEQDQVKRARCAFKTEWRAGELVVVDPSAAGVSLIAAIGVLLI